VSPLTFDRKSRVKSIKTTAPTLSNTKEKYWEKAERTIIIYFQSMEMLGLFYDPDESMYLRNAK
jgi:hypothetical protein